MPTLRVLVHHGKESRLGSVAAHDLVHDLTVPDKEEGRPAIDAEVLSYLGVVADVDLKEPHRPELIHQAQLLVVWRDHVAGGAVVRRKVDDGQGAVGRSLPEGGQDVLQRSHLLDRPAAEGDMGPVSAGWGQATAEGEGPRSRTHAGLRVGSSGRRGGKHGGADQGVVPHLVSNLFENETDDGWPFAPARKGGAASHVVLVGLMPGIVPYDMCHAKSLLFANGTYVIYPPSIDGKQLFDTTRSQVKYKQVREYARK